MVHDACLLGVLPFTAAIAVGFLVKTVASVRCIWLSLRVSGTGFVVSRFITPYLKDVSVCVRLVMVSSLSILL